MRETAAGALLLCWEATALVPGRSERRGPCGVLRREREHPRNAARMMWVRWPLSAAAQSQSPVSVSVSVYASVYAPVSVSVLQNIQIAKDAGVAQPSPSRTRRTHDAWPFLISREPTRSCLNIISRAC